jgi:hypothetical protein
MLELHNINITIVPSGNFMSVTICGIEEGVYPLGEVYIRGYKTDNYKITKRGTIDIIPWCTVKKFLFLERLAAYNKYKRLPKWARRFLDLPIEEPIIIPNIKNANINSSS